MAWGCREREKLDVNAHDILVCDVQEVLWTRGLNTKINLLRGRIVAVLTNRLIIPQANQFLWARLKKMVLQWYSMEARTLRNVSSCCRLPKFTTQTHAWVPRTSHNNTAPLKCPSEIYIWYVHCERKNLESIWFNNNKNNGKSNNRTVYPSKTWRFPWLHSCFVLNKFSNHISNTMPTKFNNKCWVCRKFASVPLISWISWHHYRVTQTHGFKFNANLMIVQIDLRVVRGVNIQT